MANEMPILDVNVNFLLSFFSFSHLYITKKAIIGINKPKIIYFNINLFYIICLTSEIR